MSELPPVLTVDEAAALLKCAPTTIQEHARNGYLPGLTLPRTCNGRPWLTPR